MADRKISSNPNIDRALQLDGDPDSVSAYYRDWAETYDRDVAESGYAGPQIAAEMLRRHVPDTGLSLLDAGCGTGLVGKLLAADGHAPIDGFDLSEPMAERARATGAYREVRGGIDMLQAGAAYADASYDAVLSIGVFTLGHVPPEALGVLVDIVRPGGWLLLSARTHYFDETDLPSVIDAEVAAQRIEIVSLLQDAPYNTDGDGHYWLFRRRA